MAYRQQRSRRSSGTSRRYQRRRPAARRVAASRYRSRKPRVAAKAQTIRIVIENPQPSFAQIPGSLPEQVGLVVPTTPRRARF